jgi:hypothetical protein
VLRCAMHAVCGGTRAVLCYRKSMNWGTLLAALTLSLWIAGCGEEDDAPLCTPGASVACVGPAGCAGAQVCNTEGTELGACSCGPGPDGGPRDMGTDGGIGDSGTHDTGTEDSGTQDSGTLDSGTQDSGTNDTGPDDSGTNEDAAVGPCNLVAQTGCEVGERCTWIEDIGNEGHAQCVIDGTVQPLAPCVPAGAGAPDDCVAGHVCLAGTCQEICTTVDGCGGDFACTPYLGFGDDETTGVCDPRCDPVSQTRLYDDAPGLRLSESRRALAGVLRVPERPVHVRSRGSGSGDTHAWHGAHRDRKRARPERVRSGSPAVLHGPLRRVHLPRNLRPRGERPGQQRAAPGRGPPHVPCTRRNGEHGGVPVQLALHTEPHRRRARRGNLPGHCGELLRPRHGRADRPHSVAQLRHAHVGRRERGWTPRPRVLGLRPAPHPVTLRQRAGGAVVLCAPHG